MGLVVALIAALVELYPLWGINSTRRRSFTLRSDRCVVCLVVLIVVTRGDAWIIGTGVASGPVGFHITPSFTALDPPLERSSNSLSRNRTPAGIGPICTVVGASSL